MYVCVYIEKDIIYTLCGCIMLENIYYKFQISNNTLKNKH